MRNIISRLMLQYLVVAIIILSGCNKNDDKPKYVFSVEDSTSIKIGVYFDKGVFDICKTETKSMLKKMKCNYTALNKDSIIYGNLQRYDLFLMPGSDFWTLKNYLTNNGMEKLKTFVDQGGGYFGICGGAYFAATTNTWRGWANNPRINVCNIGLNLFSGIADGPIEDFAPTYVNSKCEIKILYADHPITKEVPQILEMYYDHGPMFLPNDDANVTLLGKTVNGDKNVLMAFQYNSGKVFLSGLHPERDDTYVSWIMVKNAILWCARK